LDIRSFGIKFLEPPSGAISPAEKLFKFGAPANIKQQDKKKAVKKLETPFFPTPPVKICLFHVGESLTKAD